MKEEMDFYYIVFDYVFIFQLLTLCISLVVIFNRFEKEWQSILKMIIQVIILFAVGTLVNWGLFELSHSVEFLRGINFLLSWLILIFGYLFFVKSPIINRILIGGTFFVSVTAIITLGRQLMIIIPPYFGNPANINLFVYSFIVLYSIIIHKLSLKEYTDLPLLSVIMMLIITFVLSALLIGKQIADMNKSPFETDSFYIFTLILYYIISICSYLMLYFYAKVRRTNVQLQVENKLLEADKERIESFETTREEFHLLRHDFYNQMNILQILLEKKDYDGLQKYFDSMQANLIHDNKYDFIDCGNSLINSVINMEILKAKRNAIEVKANINVPSELPFESSDISRILVNLIDNSIEGLLRIEDKERLVACSILTHGEYLYIGVQNKISSDAIPEKVLMMNTEKEDSINHGFGHRIIKKIANKYNGHVNYSIENDTFFAEVMLDIKYDTKEEDK